mgnify:CR=1 FL=1
MQKIAIIGASYLQLPLVKRAKEMGLYTICFAWEKGAVCKDIADKFYPISIVEKEQILDVCRQEQIDGICTIASDVAAPTVAYVAEQMGLVGNSYECALRANDKYLMRNALQSAGILCPLFQMVKSAEEELNNAFTYPLIIKPTDRSGSLGVTKVSDVVARKYALQTALEYSFKHEAIVEEYIEGREISVEFISYLGKHYPLQITDKVTTGAPHFVELEHHQPADLTTAQYEEIYAITKRALTALGVTNGASHSEYRITADGKIYVMEIGARMGGDFIGSDLVQLSTGYDFLRGVIEVALGEFTSPARTINKHSGVYFLCAETGYLDLYFQQPPSCIVAYERTRGTLSPVSCSSDRSGYLIYQSDKKLVL